MERLRGRERRKKATVAACGETRNGPGSAAMRTSAVARGRRAQFRSRAGKAARAGRSRPRRSRWRRLRETSRAGLGDCARPPHDGATDRARSRALASRTCAPSSSSHGRSSCRPPRCCGTWSSNSCSTASPRHRNPSRGHPRGAGNDGFQTPSQTCGPIAVMRYHRRGMLLPCTCQSTARAGW